MLTCYTKSNMPDRVIIQYRGDHYVLLSPTGDIIATATGDRAARMLSNHAFACGAWQVTHEYDPTVLPGWYQK